MIDLDQIGAAAFIIERVGQQLICQRFNRAAETLFETDRAALLHRPFSALLPETLLREFRERFERCLAEGTQIQFEQAITLTSGEAVLETTLTPLSSDGADPPSRVLGVSVDCTEQHRLQHDLEVANARLTVAIESLGGAYWYYDKCNQHFESGNALERLFGKSIPSPASLEQWAGLVHPDDRNDTCFADLLAGRIEQGQAEFRVVSNDGDMRWFRCRRRVVPDGAAMGGIAGVVVDITEEKQREAALTLQASSDPLTGLANRRRFEEFLAAETDPGRSQPLWLLMIDVDFFKLFNDTYGHIAGDAVLRGVARCLREAIAPLGGLVARYGGEEFAAVLPGYDGQQATEAARSILRRVGSMQQPHARSPFGSVTVSVGIAGQLTGTFSKRKLDLVALADAALYQAKSDGRNCYRIMQASPSYQQTREASAA